jgi:uncharacterized delta-60 repeat protein
MKRILLFLFAACGDNNGAQTPDAGEPDGSEPDASTFVAPMPVAVPLSTSGHDQLLATAPVPGGGGGNGGFYAVGFRSPSFEATSDREMVLVKLNGMGQLDTTFGTDGVATLNGQVGGNAETWRGIAVQPGGKIVVSGTVEDETDATDRDILIARFTAAGVLDTTFNTTGTLRLDLSQKGATTKVDATWGLATDSTGRIYVHAGQKADGNTDTDFAVLRLTADGALDTTWATAGKYTLDIQRGDANVRNIYVLSDGSVIGAGYAASTSTGDTVQPVVYKLSSTGEPVMTFGAAGLFHEVVLGAQTEVYGLAFQPDGKMVTAGYGRDSAPSANDWVSLRLTADGQLDTTWGTAGKFILDPTGTNVGDNCRNAIALPNGRTALIGSGGAPQTDSDAFVAILDSTGKLDPAFGTGVLRFNLGANDAFFGGAVATGGKRAMFTGFKGGGMTPSATSNDDAHVVSLELE